MMSNAPSFERLEALAFRRQQTAFCVLTLFVLAVLLLLHTLFASLLGEPSGAVVLLLGLSFSIKLLEIIWLQGRREGVSEKIVERETALSNAGIFLLAFLLAFYTNRDDAPYFVLLAIPILQCAYHFGLISTLLTIAAAIGTMFAWIQHYFALHPPPRPTEYLEFGMVAVIYSLMGPLVWYLVNQLKQKEERLYEKMAELELTRERLVAEEKLAAVGRLASGIAHEIRNPVAMISSSLSTATHPETDAEVRDEMFAVATEESRRLERLTADFLTYARPSRADRSPLSIRDLLSYVSSVTKAHAGRRSIAISCELSEELPFEVDVSQVEGALLNLVLNAIDATNEGGVIKLSAALDGEILRIDVQNSGSPIPEADLARIFEPFFTTKPSGTGLGLAIARGAARAHGGDLWLSSNQDGRVTFSMSLKRTTTE